VTEDIHWSDRATIQLMDHVARRRGNARLMWLASFRVAEALASTHPFNSVRRELSRHELCEEITLHAFTDAETADHLAHRTHMFAAAGQTRQLRVVSAHADVGVRTN
jgi:predicted ATPase